MSGKLYIKKLLVFIFACLVLHAILLLSVAFSYQYTNQLINVDVLLVIICCAYTQIAYTLFFSKNTHKPKQREGSQ